MASIASTNGEMLARLSRGETVGEGAWLIADRQTAGRGRLGRNWQDGAGNFMGSTVVALRGSDPVPHTLALVAGVAVHSAVAGLAPDAMLKWPNDLLVGGAKLAGLLLERQGDCIVIGVGVNLASAPELPDRATVSLAELGVAVERDAFAADLASRLAAELAIWRSAGLTETLARWTARGPRIGARIAANPHGDERLTGTYRGLDPEGGLLMRLDTGAIRAIHAGEVELVRPEED
ncbi:biotin--[acetyl-CoA-carboxylase] ligase [Croceicoccus mobilis]|nr:biotin--[acetyl-CoA-carboxylase] ligase [Croceicoccus mobilis]